MPAPTPATDAELAALVLAYLSLPPDRSGILRPRPPYLPHPRRRLPRVPGVLRCSTPWGLLRLPLSAP
jgi:hypothetical protein